MADASSGALDGATLAFVSAGKSIAVDWYRAAQPGVRPAVLLLHGQDGPARSRFVAPQLTAHGYHAVLIHYFDGSGDSALFGGSGLINFLAWMRVVADAAGWAAARENVDPEGIALMGVSLGASVALAQASQDRLVKAVINFFGMLPLPVLGMMVRMPPTLVLHGAQDWVVPVAAAYQLDAFLKTLGAVHETHIYLDAGHGFHGATAADAMRRTVAFLDRHLGAR
jgi:dienelactone hydrolase